MLKSLVKPFQHGTLENRELENDEFQFHYTASERPHIQNDTITINHRFAHDHLIKLSISHALSQSTKLCVFEERVLEIVQSTRDLPEHLASAGTCDLYLSKMIGALCNVMGVGSGEQFSEVQALCACVQALCKGVGVGVGSGLWSSD